MAIEEFRDLIPSSMLGLSGSVYYSGRDAFSGTSPLYILGLNPGGDPAQQADETVDWHSRKVVNEMPDDWSAYRDESWKGAAPGTWGMQPRVLHLFDKLSVNPGSVAASNIVFLRSARENTFAGNMQEAAKDCWKFHERVIGRLKVRVVLCFGQKAGEWVCRKLGAFDPLGEFVENNKRKWTSRSFASTNGYIVVVATHPSIADWTNRQTDSTGLVSRALTVF